MSVQEVVTRVMSSHWHQPSSNLPLSRSEHSLPIWTLSITSLLLLTDNILILSYLLHIPIFRSELCLHQKICSVTISGALVLTLNANKAFVVAKFTVFSHLWNFTVTNNVNVTSCVRHSITTPCFKQEPSWSKGKRVTAVRVWRPLAKKSTANQRHVISCWWLLVIMKSTFSGLQFCRWQYTGLSSFV